MGKPNARQLASRDPALAALTGAIGGNGSDFGVDFGADYAYSGAFGYEFGDDYGADAPLQAGQMTGGFTFAPQALGLPPSPAPVTALTKAIQSTGGNIMQSPVPPPAVAAQLWAKHVSDQERTQERLELLEPNKGSRVKVERYAFAVNATLTLGTASAIDAQGNPDVNIRPQRLSINAPVAGFCTISEIKVANVSVTVGGTQDAFDYNANGVGQTLDMPTLTPANRARVLGNYTGLTPTGYTVASTFTLCISFKGPASIMA